jgi:hypothetical protein
VEVRKVAEREAEKRRGKKEKKKGEKRQLILHLLRQYLSPGSEKHTKRKQTMSREAPQGGEKKRKEEN